MKDFSNKIYTEGLFIPLMEISLKFLEKISIFYVIRLLFGEKQQNPPKEEIPEPKLVGATSQEKRNLFKPRCSLIFGFFSITARTNTYFCAHAKFFTNDYI